jgi:hypothetical protein
LIDIRLRVSPRQVWRERAVIPIGQRVISGHENPLHRQPPASATISNKQQQHARLDPSRSKPTI